MYQGPPQQPYGQQPGGWGPGPGSAGPQSYMVQCPTCGNGVSSAAPQCPRCGHPLARAYVAPVNKSGGSTLLVLLLVLGLVVVVAGGVGAFVFMREATPPTAAGDDPSSPGGLAPGAGGGGGVGGIGNLVGRAVRSPQVMVNEEIAIDASGAQMRGFTLSSPAPVSVEVQGRKNTDKGFMVFVMPESEWEKFKGGAGTSQQMSEFQGLKVRSFEHTGTLPAGSWAVVVQNSQNFMNTMAVQLRVVIDPK